MKDFSLKACAKNVGVHSNGKYGTFLHCHCHNYAP